MSLPHYIAIFYKLPWFCSTKVIYEKSQCNAENACGKNACGNQMCKLGRTAIHVDIKMISVFDL